MFSCVPRLPCAMNVTHFFLCWLQDSIKLHGEVFFPNLQLEKTVVDFGCILNNTEATRFLNITNNSPLPVSYRWSFVIDNQPVAMIRKPPDSSQDLSMELENGEYNREPSETSERSIQLEPETLDVTIEQLAGSPRNNLESSLSVEVISLFCSAASSSRRKFYISLLLNFAMFNIVPVIGGGQ